MKPSLARAILAGISLLALAVAAALALGLHRRAARPPTASAAIEDDGPAAAGQPRGPRAPLFAAPDFSLPDQDNRVVTRDSLLGHPWVADFIFTHCTTACPILSARMVQLQRRVRAPEARFVSFSVDPANDTPAALKEYAARWHADPRWELLSTQPDTLAAVTHGFKVPAQPTADARDPIMHSSKLILLDAQGQVRDLYDSDDDGELARLAQDLEALAGQAPPPSGSADAGVAIDGEQLFRELGCNGCHLQAAIAALLAGVAGSQVMLEGGKTELADAAYLRESIVAPAAKLVQGYGPTMPAYATLSAAQLDALVAYLQSLAAAPHVEAAARHDAIDPVCGMHVSAAADSPHESHGGETYYFCSDTCRAKFKAHPARYLAAAHAR